MVCPLSRASKVPRATSLGVRAALILISARAAKPLFTGPGADASTCTPFGFRVAPDEVARGAKACCGHQQAHLEGLRLSDGSLEFDVLS